MLEHLSFCSISVVVQRFNSGLLHDSFFDDGRPESGSLHCETIYNFFVQVLNHQGFSAS